MLVRFEQIKLYSYGSNDTKCWAFWQKKTEFFITIFDKELTPFWKKYIKPSSSQGEWLPHRDFSLLPQNEKESDLSHLYYNLKYILCVHFGKKIGGTPGR